MATLNKPKDQELVGEDLLSIRLTDCFGFINDALNEILPMTQFVIFRMKL